MPPLWVFEDENFLIFPHHIKELLVSLQNFLKQKIMGRILAIDYGIKRCGLAATDPERIISTGLTTVETGKLLSFLQDYCKKEPVDCFVVGEPKHMDNTPSDSAQIIEPFVRKLAATFPDRPIHRIDERFTSKLAFQTMIDSGLRKKQRQNKALVDEISACIILQDFMSMQERNNEITT